MDYIIVRRINKVDKDGVLAFFDITVNGVEINGVKLIKSKTDGELFLSFPAEKGKDEKYYNIVYIDDVNLYREVARKLTDTYEKIL